MKLKLAFCSILLASLTLALPSYHTSAICTLPACDLSRIFFESNFTDEVGYINITCYGTNQGGSRTNYYDHTEYGECGYGYGTCGGVDYRCSQGVIIDASVSAYIGNACATYQPLLYEAESATLNGAVVSDVHAGYTGAGFVDYLNASGDYIEWTVTVPSAVTKTLNFRYANNGTGDRPLELKVNSSVVNGSLSFPVTGDWATWSTSSATSVSLNSGANTIRLTATGSSGANIDSLTVVAP